jgi:hypothetical protein
MRLECLRLLDNVVEAFRKFPANCSAYVRSAANYITWTGQHLGALALLQKLLQGLNEVFLGTVAPDVENDIYEVVA